MNEDQAPRQNRDGDPCPPWCVTDHARYSFHGSERITVPAPDYRIFYVHAIQRMHDRPGIQLAGVGLVSVRSDDAADLAAIFEQLADATPEQHRGLAAAIRKAAADITGETGEKP